MTISYEPSESLLIVDAWTEARPVSRIEQLASRIPRPIERRLWLARHPLLGIRSAAARRWGRRAFVDPDAVGTAIDPALWGEAVSFGEELEERHGAEFQRLRRSIRLGGRSEYRLLHLLTRLTKPSVAVETGVAAGWSSAAILAAMERNGHGRLWSSELVYDRPWLHEDYGPLVGMVVEPAHRERWTLKLDGDRENLPRILEECGPIDLFHFDSDKSDEGRAFAFDLVLPRLAEQAVIVVDDVNDGSHFRRLVKRLDRPYLVTGRNASVGILWEGLARPAHP